MPDTATGVFARIAGGDASAVQEAVDRFGGLVWALARRWSDDPDEAEDAVQEVFVALWKSAARYDPAKCSERGFVAMITRRRMIDRLRARGRGIRLEPMPEGYDVASDEHERVDEQAQAHDARAVLAQLTPLQRRMLELHLLEGKTHEQIAGETATPLGTVKSHIRRGLLRARALVSGAQGRSRGSR